MTDYSSSLYDLNYSAKSLKGSKGIRHHNRPKPIQLWRSTSLINLICNTNKSESPVYDSVPEISNFSRYNSTESLSSINSEKRKRAIWGFKELQGLRNNWDTIVNLVLVAAKGLPPSPSDDAVHELYCKIILGSESFKSKPVPHSGHAEWRERFKLRLYNDHSLKLSLWNKGRQKMFIGSCVVDLATLEKERTHEIWQKLDDGYGSIHISLTMCNVRFPPQQCDEEDVHNKRLDTDLGFDRSLVGSLHVKIIKAKGLGGKPSAYCTLELENEVIQTHRTRSGTEPTWNKEYVFNIYDVTSVLQLKVYGSSLRDKFLKEFRGQVSIPLLKIKESETRWYALKNKNNQGIAKGNCPRVLLQTSIHWDPVKATIKLFRPKEVKYMEKPYRLDIPLLFKNLVSLVNLFNALLRINENFKCLFEWNNRKLSACSLLAWLIFCYLLKPWMVPFMLLLTFVFCWVSAILKDVNGRGEKAATNTTDGGPNETQKENKGLSYKINDMHDIILTVSLVLQIAISLVERIKTLYTFRVPFLSYVLMALLGIVSVTLYFMPFNYLLMFFGIYKFMRKYLNPDRKVNNDLIDFISRIPDNRELKDWEELNVPEPNQ